MYCRISEKMDFVIGRTAESLPEKKKRNMSLGCCGR